MRQTLQSLLLPANRRRLALVSGLIVAAAITLFFGARLVGRIINRPTYEPIRAWMSVQYVARSYGVPPHVLQTELGLPVLPPDRRPLQEIATEQNRDVNELIRILEERIKRGPPFPPPPPPEPPRPRPTP